MKFRIGQKVQFFTHKAPWYWWWAVTEPRGHFQIGETLIVSGTETRWFGIHQLLFFANHPDHSNKSAYPGYLSFHFRSVVEHKTAAGMAVLKKVAAEATVPASPKRAVTKREIVP